MFWKYAGETRDSCPERKIAVDSSKHHHHHTPILSFPLSLDRQIIIIITIPIIGI
jgi:hypothetical protein